MPIIPAGVAHRLLDDFVVDLRSLVVIQGDSSQHVWWETGKESNGTTGLAWPEDDIVCVEDTPVLKD